MANKKGETHMHELFVLGVCVGIWMIIVWLYDVIIKL